MEQRELALIEQRNRIIMAARATYTLRLDMGNGIDSQITIENKSGTDIDFEAVLTAVNAYASTVDQSAKNFEEVADGIYNEVAKLYSERDIEVQVINNNSGVAFTKEYHTHKPNLSIAI
jgi:hypothetical protein